MISSPGNLFVRANYLVIGIFAPMIAAGRCVLIVPMLVRREGWPAIAHLCLPAMSCSYSPACARSGAVLNGSVIPPELVSERPIVSFVVTLFGGFAISFRNHDGHAIGIALAPEWPEEAKKIRAR